MTPEKIEILAESLIKKRDQEWIEALDRLVKIAGKRDAASRSWTMAEAWERLAEYLKKEMTQ